MKTTNQGKRTMIRIFQVTILILIMLLGISTFIGQHGEPSTGRPENALTHWNGWLQWDRFYQSPVHIALWGLLALLLLVSVTGGLIRRCWSRLMHLLLAICIILIGAEKSLNRRTMIAIPENVSIRLADRIPASGHSPDVVLTLQKFEIQLHSGTRTPRAFISHLIANHRDTLRLSVNHPLAFGRFRLYQNDFDPQPVYDIQVGDQPYRCGTGDTLTTPIGTVRIGRSDGDSGMITLRIGETTHKLRPDEPITFAGRPVRVKPAGYRFVSYIEVVEVRGIGLLLMSSVLYLTALGIALLRLREQAGRDC